jgi:hypothetical protein
MNIFLGDLGVLYQTPSLSNSKENSVRFAKKVQFAREVLLVVIRAVNSLLLPL